MYNSSQVIMSVSGVHKKKYCILIAIIIIMILFRKRNVKYFGSIMSF